MSGVRFFEQAHVKDVCSILRVLYNLKRRNSFVRLLGLLPGVGDRNGGENLAPAGRQFRRRSSEQRQALAKALPATAQSVWSKINQLFEDYHSPKARPIQAS